MAIFGPDVTLEDLAFLADCAPKVDHLAIQLLVHLIKVPAPLPKASHPADTRPPDIASEQWPETAPPMPNGLMVQVDSDTLNRQS